MAEDADELTEYLLHYPYLSAYAHGNVISIYNYCSFDKNGFLASNIENMKEVYYLYQISAQFFTCFVITLAEKFDLKIKELMMNSWKI